MKLGRGLVLGVSVALAGVLLSACSSRPNRAPVEDRGAAVPGSVVGMVPAKPLPGAENAGKPGYYTVKPGDTLIRIGLEHGQSWKDIARWSNLENPNLIEVGQVVRVVPPVSGAAAAAAVASDTGVVTRPIVPSGVAPASASATSAKGLPSAAPAGEDDVPFAWPANGSLIAGFDEARNKGYDIAGKAGDPVLAAADGRVVYAGSGLRGYGNLIILKHNNTFLTAYAHNQALLVKEDQSVKRGQKIAEMGSSDADRVKLHFEIRRQGKPVDPSRYLPAR